MRLRLWFIMAAGAGLLAANAPAAAQPVGSEADPTPFPDPGSVKGLQVQMVEEAVELGVRHAALNVSLGRLLAVAGTPGAVEFRHRGRTWTLSGTALASLDERVRPLSEAGVVVYLILLAYPGHQPGQEELVIHPGALAAPGATVAAFNIVSDEGRAFLEAASAALASRYSGPSSVRHGRVWGYIVGNEANSHWIWFGRGPGTLAEVVADYETAVRLVHQGVRGASRHARVYLSLDHHWTAAAPGATAEQAVPGRAFLEEFARRARASGDFDWHLAHHPYPDDLGNPRTWLDRSATPDPGSPHVTFKNLEVLAQFLREPAMMHEGGPRRLILSEQGFHCLPGEEGERLQAAAFCYAWEKVRRCSAVDAFIWHRHVDHAHEGGLRLGLRERLDGTVSTPGRARLVYRLFQAAGTPQWEEAAAFALPITGLSRWDELAGCGSE